MIRRNEEAVSPVIGVILMVAITVILAAVIAAFVFGLGGQQQQAPTASITAANNPDTTSYDMKIQHKGGDTLKGGDWKLSVVEVATGSAPNFVISQSGSDLGVGAQIKVQNITITPLGANDTLSNTTFTKDPDAPTTALKSGTKYDVKLVHIPSNAMLLDQVIEVR